MTSFTRNCVSSFAVWCTIAWPDHHHQPEKFLRYVPAPLETKWAELVSQVNPTNCKEWEPGARLAKEAAQDVKSGGWDLSVSHFEYQAHNGSIVSYPIEPLFSSLRHPYLLTSPDNATRARLMDKSYYRLAQRLQPHSRIIFVDLGASLYDAGPGGDNGASLHWFWDTYSRLAARTRPFDRILAWEAHEYKQKDLWDSFPPDIISALSYFDVPTDSKPGAKMNPWRVLKEVARPHDYVVVKIDVDHQATELALVHQLLESPEVANLIDELFWEHHVAGSSVCCPTLWQSRNGAGWSRMRFNTLNADEVLRGSYALFSRLREMGICAHSWV